VNNEQNHIDELIARSLAGETTAHEENELAAWKGLSGENQAHFLALKKAFEMGERYLKDSKKLASLNIDQEWNQFLQKSQAGRAVNMLPLPAAPRTTFNWLRIAAAIVLVAVSGFIVNYLISDHSIVIETAKEEITLPDGSRVTLNANSRISFASEFNTATREVTLEGEAFFDVTRNPQKPFIINAREAKVEVLGTSFNVRAYQAQENLEVVVQTGTVKVSVAEVQKEVMLQAGDRGVFARANMSLVQTTNADINFLAWKTQQIIFMETDLRTVVETLNRTYQANIRIAADIPTTCAVTVTFDKQSLEAVLNVLKTTLNLTLQNESGGVVITHADC
jgi:transmembrane sensor